MTTPTRSPAGLVYGLAAYGLWGLMPLYFRVVKDVNPLELLAHRVVWMRRAARGPDDGPPPLARGLGRACGSPKTCGLLAASTVLIAVNWYAFIVGVSTRQVVQNSLGYFINPLFSILLGVVVFGERLRPAQWLAPGAGERRPGLPHRRGRRGATDRPGAGDLVLALRPGPQGRPRRFARRPDRRDAVPRPRWPSPPWSSGRRAAT